LYTSVNNGVEQYINSWHNLTETACAHNVTLW